MARILRSPNGRLGVVLATLFAIAACAKPSPGAIHYDVDACDHCRMVIADPRFAGQLVTRTGKVYRFDDPGCLASFVKAARVSPRDIHSIWLNDHSRPETLLSAENAVFVVSPRIKAPMNGGTAAFGSHSDAAALQSSVGGVLRGWVELLNDRAS